MFYLLKHMGLEECRLLFNCFTKLIYLPYDGDDVRCCFRIVVFDRIESK